MFNTAVNTKLNNQRKCSYRKTKCIFVKHVCYKDKSYLHTRQTCRLSVLCSRAISFPATYTITAVGTVHTHRRVPLDLNSNVLNKSNPHNINHRGTWVEPTNKSATRLSPSNVSCRFSSKPTMRPRSVHLRLAGQNFARANSRRGPPQECFGWG